MSTFQSIIFSIQFIACLCKYKISTEPFFKVESNQVNFHLGVQTQVSFNINETRLLSIFVVLVYYKEVFFLCKNKLCTDQCDHFYCWPYFGRGIRNLYTHLVWQKNTFINKDWIRRVLRTIFLNIHSTTLNSSSGFSRTSFSPVVFCQVITARHVVFCKVRRW